MKSLERIIKLYEDWLSTKTNKYLNEVVKDILNYTSPILSFNKLLIEMEKDGELINQIFYENLNEISNSEYSAKRKVSSIFKKIIENSLNEEKDGSVVTDIGQSYYPIADRSKSMESIIDPNDRDLIIQIRHAITGGNMMIAQELIKNSWGKLSLKQRNGLIEFVNRINLYNSMTDVPKGKGMKMKPLEKRSDLTKDEFAEKLLRTAKENMEIN